MDVALVSAGRPDRRWKIVGVLAVAVPLFMWAAFLGLGLTRSGYNLLTDQASQLGARGTPNATLFTLGFFYAGGLLTLALGLALFRLSTDRVWRAGALMVALTGALLAITGYFPTAGVSSQVTQIHMSVSQVCFGVASVSPLVLLAGSRNLAVPTSVRRFWLASSSIALSIEALAVILRGRTHFPEGVFQRPFLTALTIWFLATGVWLIKHHRVPAFADIPV